jgi:hypothetical protein
LQGVGEPPFENMIVDFTEMPQARGCKYILVFVCTFSGWVKAFPTQTEKAQKSGQVPVKRNHPSIQNTCLYWVK